MAGIYGCFKGRNSDSAAMASGPPDVTANQEPAEVVEECSGKKKSKFQTFKKFFARKKRKEASVFGVEGGLKASQSSDNVNNEPENGTLTRSEKDNGSGSKVSLGSKALSHDSIFVSDSSEAHEALGASQDSIPGKVKSLQMQLKQAIRLGSPPSLMCVKKMEDPAAMSEDDGLPCSPPEYSALHTVLKQVQTNSSLSLEGTDSDEDQLSCAASSRAVSPLVVVPGDFSQPASPNVCLDNSAAKHKLGLRHKAHAKRKPSSRVELRIEGDSLMDETLSTSIAESVEERDEQERGDLSGEQLRMTEEEERNEEKGEEERERLQHSIRSPLRDAEEEEGEEDELGAGADVSHAPDASSALLSDGEQRLPEEEAPDGQLPASPSTRASRLTPEPPTCQREYLPDTSLTYRRGAGETGSERDFPLGLAEGEDDDDDDGVLGNIGGMESGEEEESSFLQEVLSSLKTPLTSRSLGLEADSIVLRVDEDKQESEEEEEEEEEGSEDALEVLEAEQDGDVEIEDEGKVNKVDREEEAVSPGSLTPPAQEQELLILDETTPSCQAFGEEEEEEDGTKEEEEKALVGQFRGHDEEEDEEEAQEAREVTPGHDTREEEDDPLTTGMNRAESDGDKEVTDPEKESEEEEGEEKEEEKHQRQEDEEEVAAWEERDGKESVEEDMGVEEDEGEEEEREEPMMEMVPGQTMVGTPTAAPVADEVLDGVQEVDPAAAAEHMDQTLIHPEPCGRPFSTEPEHQATFSRSSADERADEEEGDDEGVEMEREMEKKPDMDTNQLEVEPTDSDQAGVETDQQDVDQASVGMSHLDMNTPEEDQSDPEQLAVEPAATQQAAVSSQPPSCAFPESHGYSETEPQEESETRVPSTPGNDTSIAAIVCTDSVSLSSQQAVTPDQQSTGAATAGEINDTATEQDTVKQSSSGLSVEEDTAGLGDKEAGKRSPTDAETIEETPQPSGPPTTTEEIEKQPSIGSDQSKVRFTIAPAWQRSLSTGGGSPDEPVVPPSPSSPTSCPSSASSSSQSNPLAKAEPVSSTKVEVVLSPTSRMRNVTAIPGKTQSNVTATPAKPQTSTVAATEESPVQGESPFGVRLRRTVVLHRFSSEEENTEPAVELPAQPAINKAAPPHPVSAKPSLSQPVAIKPALPRKPDVQGEKPKCTPDMTSARGVPSGSDPPSWISVARQKQRIYKDSSLDESTLRKEEPERKSSLPLYVSSAACRDHLKTPELSSKGSSLETTKPTTPVEKEGRRAFSPPTPVPPQPAKSQSHPAPIAPKPLSQPTPSPRALSAPTPVPVSQRVSPYASPPSLAKTPPSTKTPQPQTSTHPNQRPLGQSSSTLTSPPFSTRSSNLAQSGTIPPRAPGLSSPTQPSQRGPLSPSSPSPSLPQDEPPWMALAKKKAKAWSEMPQIVQ